VCDACNQYFGSKLEKRILESPPFSIERVAAAIKTKKGKYAGHREPDLRLLSTGYWDHVLLVGEEQRAGGFPTDTEGKLLVFPPRNYADMLVRFLLKMGLELLATTDEEDPYAPDYDKSRSCARYGRGADKWDVAYGLYPRRTDLTVGHRQDDIGPLETRQIYEFSLGVLPSGDRAFFFAFITHCFACNLSSPSIQEYLVGFNSKNEFRMRSRWD